MNAPWFSNVGQIIQTVIQLSALVLSGVMAWPQLRDNNLLTGGAIIFYLMVGWVLVSAGLVISSPRSSSAPPTPTPLAGSQSPAAPTPPTPSSGPVSDRLVFGPPIVPTVAADTTSESETSKSLPGDLTVVTFKRKVGDFWQFPGRDIRIEVRSIRENTQKRYDEEENGAELYVTTGGGLVFGGERAIQITTNCYYLALAKSQNREPWSVYFWYFSNKGARFFAACLDHINPHTGVVTINVCDARGA
jgi:hypothetical protein